jgi:hypothetical protein
LFGMGGFPSSTLTAQQQYAKRFKSESSFGESFDRQMIEREKSSYLQFGQLPRGFEFLPGQMGRLGSPEAVAARGAMPLGGYGEVAGVPGMPRGGLYTRTANVGRESTYAGSRATSIEPGIEIPSTPGKFGLSTSTRNQLTLGREPGRRDISLDFNSVGLNARASGALLVVPDNASPEEITAAKQYLKGLQDLMEKHGHKGYALLGGGVHGPGIRTTSENKRGVPGVFHTEGWFAGDQKAVDIMSMPEAQQEYANLLSKTLGNISGARFIPPHIAGGNEGATKNIKVGNGRQSISETEFARTRILPYLQQIREDMDKGGGPQPTSTTTTQNQTKTTGISSQSADELKKQFNLDFRQNKFAREKNLGAIFGNAPGAPGGTTGLEGRPHLSKYDPEVIDKSNARGQFKIVTHKTMEEGSAATLAHYLHGGYLGKTLLEANTRWTGNHPYVNAMKELGLDPKMKITKEVLANPEIAEKLIRMHLIGEASVRQGKSPIDIPSENLRRAHQYFMLKEGLGTTDVSQAGTLTSPTSGYTPQRQTQQFMPGVSITPAPQLPEFFQRGTQTDVSPEMSTKTSASEVIRGASLYGTNIGSFRGLCGVGTRSVVGSLLNAGYFARGLGTTGAANAAALSGDNNYLQKSGFYNDKQNIGKNQLTKEYLDSLPIGTVISSSGGKRGLGHVQVKIGPGHWVSDADQKGMGVGGVLVRGYDNFAVHLPNEKAFRKMNADLLARDPSTQNYIRQMGIGFREPTVQEVLRGLPGTTLTEEQKKKFLEQKYQQTTGKDASQNQEDFEKWKSEYGTIEGTRRQAEMVPGTQITPEPPKPGGEGTFAGAPGVQQVSDETQQPSAGRFASPMPLTDVTPTSALPSVSSGTTSAASGSPEAPGIVDQTQTPGTAPAAPVTPMPMPPQTLPQPAAPLPGGSAVGGVLGGMRPSEAAPRPQQSEEEKERERVYREAIAPPPAASPQQQYTGPAAPTTPQEGTGRSGSSGQSTGGGGGGNHPESAQASPGSGGMGSYGRCFV